MSTITTTAAGTVRATPMADGAYCLEARDRDGAKTGWAFADPVYLNADADAGRTLEEVRDRALDDALASHLGLTREGPWERMDGDALGAVVVQRLRPTPPVEAMTASATPAEVRGAYYVTLRDATGRHEVHTRAVVPERLLELGEAAAVLDAADDAAERAGFHRAGPVTFGDDGGVTFPCRAIPDVEAPSWSSHPGPIVAGMDRDPGGDVVVWHEGAVGSVVASLGGDRGGFSLGVGLYREDRVHEGRLIVGDLRVSVAGPNELLYLSPDDVDALAALLTEAGRRAREYAAASAAVGAVDASDGVASGT